MESKQNFHECIHCTSGIYCTTCRKTSEEGVNWRKSIIENFEVKNNEINFECPKNREWDKEFNSEIIISPQPEILINKKEIKDKFFCPVYELEIEGNMEEICEKCKNDPIYKQNLFTKYLFQSKEKSLSTDCISRSKDPIRETGKKCCGGKKKVPIFNCSKHNTEVLQEECKICILAQNQPKCEKK